MNKHSPHNMNTTTIRYVDSLLSFAINVGRFCTGCRTNSERAAQLAKVRMRLSIYFEFVVGHGFASIRRDDPNHFTSRGRLKNLIVKVINGQDIDGACVLLSNADNRPSSVLLAYKVD